LPHLDALDWRGSGLEWEGELLNSAETFPFGDENGGREAAIDGADQAG
jgi:hypothetical protein